MSDTVKYLAGLISLMTVAVGAAWNTRDFADQRAKEVLTVFQETLAHHEATGHRDMIRRDDYTRDIARISATLDRLDDKLDRLTRGRRAPAEVE